MRSVYEDLATTPTRGRDEKDRLKALAALDSLPVALRANIGRFLIEGLEEAATLPDEGGAQWRFRRPVGGRGEAHLGFGVCSQQFKAYSEDPFHHDVLGWWVQLRHHELQQITDDPGLTTVGVVLSPRNDGQRLFDTTMAVVSGDLGLTDEELSAFRKFWARAQDQF